MKAMAAAAERLARLKRKESAMLRGACPPWVWNKLREEFPWAWDLASGAAPNPAAQTPIRSVSPLVTPTSGLPAPCVARVRTHVLLARSRLAVAFAFFLNAVLFCVSFLLPELLAVINIVMSSQVAAGTEQIESSTGSEGASLWGPTCRSLYIYSR